MTTSQHTRTALSEIPDRLEQLRVATTPSNRIADEPTPANILNATTFANSVNNLFPQQTPTASPDEFVIRQRGRRSITLSWSPDKLSTQSLFQKTPTKCLGGTPLRSSPRKRLLITETYLTKSPVKCNGGRYQKLSNSTGIKSVNSAPIVKKLRLDERPVAQTNFNTNLLVLLKGLSEDQLVQMIGSLATKDSELEEKIRSEFPMADIGYMEDELLSTKRNIFKSLPVSRLCKKTDSNAYSKAAIHLSAFKTAIVNHTRKLRDSSHWDALLDYVILAWNYVRATPIWDNNSHNAIRRHCFKVLTCHCVAALKCGGLRLGAQRLSNLECQLKEWSNDYEDVLSCINTLNKTLIKLRTNL